MCGGRQSSGALPPFLRQQVRARSPPAATRRRQTPSRSNSFEEYHDAPPPSSHRRDVIPSGPPGRPCWWSGGICGESSKDLLKLAKAPGLKKMTLLAAAFHMRIGFHIPNYCLCLCIRSQLTRSPFTASFFSCWFGFLRPKTSSLIEWLKMNFFVFFFFFFFLKPD